MAPTKRSQIKSGNILQYKTRITFILFALFTFVQPLDTLRFVQSVNLYFYACALYSSSSQEAQLYCLFCLSFDLCDPIKYSSTQQHLKFKNSYSNIFSKQQASLTRQNTFKYVVYMWNGEQTKSVEEHKCQTRYLLIIHEQALIGGE
ncbi:Hypothetical_protein [Hexamita inflata]|uniref:Hypothetical_protein n=1 Tax=Hexamita inflata TaxID=28002 RepID=A0AA86NGQ6_9EUKA|nr:Hypothetical protein HINF_LOCUS6455 [Hexamita inflata]